MAEDYTENPDEVERTKKEYSLTALGCCVGVCLMLGIWGYSLFFPSLGNKLLQEKDPPKWLEKYVMIDVSRYLPQSEFEVNLEFAVNNVEYLLLWSIDLSRSGPMSLSEYFTKGLGENLVINFRGGRVEESTNKQRELLPPYVKMFPKTSYRQTAAEFIRDAEIWAFSPDGMYGMKSGTCYKGDKGNAWTFYCPVQLWDFTQHRLLWEKDYEGYSIKLSHFISWRKENCLLIAFNHSAYIVSQETGKIVGEFQCLLPEEQNLPFDDRFSAFRIAYNDKKRWLAIGEFEGRRTRIYSIDPPYPLLHEISTGIPPHPPLGGGWMVNEVTVNANGKYLIVEYEYSGRYIVTTCFPTEVYDTDTWELVWYENKEEVYGVTISPNGKKIAFLRDKVLEIGDFTPTPINLIKP